METFFANKMTVGGNLASGMMATGRCHDFLAKFQVVVESMEFPVPKRIMA